jgi:hypothetical protein
MPNVLIHKASELRPETRTAVEAELGRSLQDAEEVSIMAFVAHDAPTGQARQELARQLEDRIARTAESVRDVPDDEQEAVINEALKHVRSKPK